MTKHGTRAAEDCASLCASWCVEYDYRYQDNTQFAYVYADGKIIGRQFSL